MDIMANMFRQLTLCCIRVTIIAITSQRAGEQAMETDYKCYLLGCQSAGIDPLEEWRFRLLQQEYLRRAAEPDQRPEALDIPAFVLEQLASLVAEGYKIAAGGGSAEGEEPGAAAAGVRESRVPCEPVLAGSAARSLPSPDSPDTSFWRT